ncbi:DNA-binding transcriptional ArsR family regulator [Anaerosolibacter carboniphilus]|uniref:DNA-binding transcriptional ArsR family regulator n=1 Tax=Anaerosolibacter carboniphilus TaxID=1417629 RepID=A0A841KYS9_9FIRM|nr:metalloregulator ArsR/SmtB family transcription factor [Anaerosolibacter carboniphilus]MBB6217478.1 DNA-binding transcriptional ArsR family regulator [Anaerosolibacter carboniphilus]
MEFGDGMRVYSGSDKNWNIEFVYSPLFEMLCSIHVLIKPDHHLERLIWAQAMRENISDKLLDDLLELGKRTADWCVIMDLCNVYEACNDFNVMSALNYMEDLSLEDFRYVFSKYQVYGLEDFTEDIKRKMIRALKEYYLGYFERELRFIEPLLVRCLKRDAERYEKIGIIDYAKRIHSRIEVTEEAFLFHKYTLFTIPFHSLKRVIVRISSFIDPHLLMDYGEGMVQFTIRAHLDRGEDAVPRDLLRIMKALSDETRLKILRIVYKGKTSTQSLAQELNLTEPCISKHLRLLYDAELVYKERSGSFIYYDLNTLLLDRIPLEIHEYLNFSFRK